MKKLAVILTLGLISFLPADVPLSQAFTQLTAFSGNPSGNIVVGTVNNVARKFNANDFLNRAYGIGTQDISTINNLQTALNNKQSLLASGTNIKTINGASLLGAGDLTISGGGGSLDTANTAQKAMLKQFTQDNAPQVDYAVDDYSFDRIGGKLYGKGMRYFPSVATSYGTVTLDASSSNAAGLITFTSNGSAIPNGGTIYTLTFVTTTYLVAPLPSVNSYESASTGQDIYPSERSVNSFKQKIKTGFTPSNGAVYYYVYGVKPAANTSAP